MQRLTTTYMSSVIAPPLPHYMLADGVDDPRDVDSMLGASASVSEFLDRLAHTVGQAQYLNWVQTLRDHQDAPVSDAEKTNSDFDCQSSFFLSRADDEVGQLRIQFDDTILLNVTAGDVSGTRDLMGLRQRLFNRAFTMAHEHDDKERHSQEMRALSSLLLVAESNHDHSDDFLLRDGDKDGLGHMIIEALYDYLEPKFH